MIINLPSIALGVLLGLLAGLGFWVLVGVGVVWQVVKSVKIAEINNRKIYKDPKKP